MVLFLRQEQKAPEPILPLTLFRNRIIAVSSLGGLALGILMFGITSYVPLFVQGVQGGTATNAGISLGPLLVAWPIAATISGRIVIRYGYRLTALLGMTFATIGTGMVTLFNTNTGVPFIVIAMYIIGTGLGLSSTAFILAVQNAVPWKLRGVATASTQFFRTIGGTIGVALMGTILNAQMALHFTPILARFADVAARLPKNVSPSNVLLTPDLRAALPATFLHQLQVGLAQSLFWVYGLMFALAVLGLATMVFLPGGRADKYSYQSAQQTSAAETSDNADVQSEKSAPVFH
jgi:MFS family permease